MVRSTPSVSSAFHADECELAQSSRAIFATITTQRLRRGTFENVRALEAAIEEYLAYHNEHCKPFVWTATADAILDKVTRFCERTSETRH